MNHISLLTPRQHHKRLVNAQTLALQVPLTDPQWLTRIGAFSRYGIGEPLLDGRRFGR